MEELKSDLKTAGNTALINAINTAKTFDDRIRLLEFDGLDELDPRARTDLQAELRKEASSVDDWIRLYRLPGASGMEKRQALSRMMKAAGSYADNVAVLEFAQTELTEAD